MSDPVLEIGEVEVWRIFLEVQPILAGHTYSRILRQVSLILSSINFFFDESVNSGRVVVEHAFEALKNRWRILKNFHMNMNMVATITLAYCILHNFCEINSEWVPLPKNLVQHPDPFVGVRRGNMRLPGDSRAGKVAKTQMRMTIF